MCSSLAFQFVPKKCEVPTLGARLPLLPFPTDCSGRSDHSHRKKPACYAIVSRFEGATLGNNVSFCFAHLTVRLRMLSALERFPWKNTIANVDSARCRCNALISFPFLVATGKADLAILSVLSSFLKCTKKGRRLFKQSGFSLLPQVKSGWG